ncbi:hypothetical protein HanRHA438_Chr11g0499651 [Helianthus annuus]|uniref:Uncharacterized protein n=1 Tax=Helianthus annuus TaxID=4232 RepID=A0A9K3HND8_HELAN|nr:hypothetical protein HanXRQr2_Chr11g0486891 [Helianthus annuus]KAJ0517183.1 hypothetical protein HanHA89_Chr11g0422411 [Helianthus annuus]KAJ0685192.1 hypothetical protein HanLR1_Chr11g0399841 [Helianthus annuus]KAJ0689103.1 hypothetical protein HanOQP8_Chr11g0401861 [Helianthus annuus]KAJ0734306.1 hypothetical protein HanPI659440_Chr11g0418481 [Helianthus annuus]
MPVRRVCTDHRVPGDQVSFIRRDFSETNFGIRERSTFCVHSSESSLHRHVRAKPDASSIIMNLSPSVKVRRLCTGRKNTHHRHPIRPHVRQVTHHLIKQLNRSLRKPVLRVPRNHRRP